jgi:hypothetical protein
MIIIFRVSQHFSFPEVSIIMHSQAVCCFRYFYTCSVLNSTFLFVFYYSASVDKLESNCHFTAPGTNSMSHSHVLKHFPDTSQVSHRKKQQNRLNYRPCTRTHSLYHLNRLEFL